MTSRLLAGALALGVTVPAFTAPGDWVELGPDGGSIQALAVAPADPLTLYAGTYGNGVFRSRDGGASWTVGHRGMGRATISALAVDPRDARHVFATTPDGRIFESEDGGTSWQLVGSTGAWVPSGKAVHAVILDDGEPPRLWVAAATTVYRSSDLGWTWSATTPGTPTSDGDAVLALAVNPGRPGEIWAGTSWGLFSSPDWGSTWAEHTLDGHAFTPATVVAIDPRDADTVYAASYDHWTGGPTAFPVYAVMRSTDGGVSWTHFFFPSVANGPPVTLAIDPADSQHLVAAAASGVAASFDGGATWPSWSSVEAYVYAALIEPTDSERILAATGSGVLVSDDAGMHWAPSDRGLRAANLGVVAVTGGSRPRILAAGGVPGLLAFDPATGAWADAGQGLLGGDLSPCCPQIASIVVDPTSRETVYAGGVSTGVFKSVDGGQQWTPARSGMEQGSRSPGNFYTPQALALDSRRPSTLYAATEKGVFKTTNGANTWLDANRGLPLWPSLWAIALGPRDAALAICGGLRTYRSTDAAERWGESAAPSSTAWTRQLFADPQSGRLYAATWRGTGGLYRSDDGGLSWTKLPVPEFVGCFTYVNSSDPTCPYVSTLAIDPAASDSLYIGTPNGVWRSTDDGLTWSQFGTATEGLSISSIVFDAASGTIYASSSGAGLLALQPARVRAHLRRVSPPLAARGLVEEP